MGISTPTGWGSSLLRVYTTQALHVFPRKTIKGTGIAFSGNGWNSLSTLKGTCIFPITSRTFLV